MVQSGILQDVLKSNQSGTNNFFCLHTLNLCISCTTVKGVRNKLFGVHLENSTSRGLGEKNFNVKDLEKKCQKWYDKGATNRIWIKADKICKPSLVKDFKG